MSRKNTVFKIQPNKSRQFLLLLIVCSILQLFVSLEPIAQSLWGFHMFFFFFAMILPHSKHAAFFHETTPVHPSLPFHSAFLQFHISVL